MPSDFSTDALGRSSGLLFSKCGNESRSLKSSFEIGFYKNQIATSTTKSEHTC